MKWSGLVVNKVVLLLTVFADFYRKIPLKLLISFVLRCTNTPFCRLNICELLGRWKYKCIHKQGKTICNFTLWKEIDSAKGCSFSLLWVWSSEPFIYFLSYRWSQVSFTRGGDNSEGRYIKTIQISKFLVYIIPFKMWMARVDHVLSPPSYALCLTGLVHCLSS